ncbi:hypothetical protein HNQ36_003474 [Afipia massiliensis]|uniref:HEPN AbiU2-like domain-containing protein n=1 Tax=Afipia massiliensis TaxID=211460 RepID=A0A840N4C7_9BRAD|nr:hypothetical protein [Afipia massiliensis]
MSDTRPPVPITDELRDRANDVLERLFALDEAVANARAFRATLEDLHRRGLSVVQEPHISAIGMVRAGTLRAAIGAIMACLDPSDWRGNRASAGQILDLLQDSTLAAVFPENAKAAADAAQALAAARTEFEALRQDKLFQDGRALRNDAIAHILIPDEPTPTVEYDTFFKLHDAAERLVVLLYIACTRGRPQYIEHEERFKRLATTFWDTYFTGMRATGT